MLGGPGGQLPQKAQVHGGILLLPAVEPSDQAQYLCRAHSSTGQHVARAMLHVHGERAGLRVGLGTHGQPREVFSQSSVYRGQWAQGPSESREDPSARRPHCQAVLQGCRCAQCHHHLEEGRGQPSPTGEGIHPGQAHRLNRVLALAICSFHLYILPHLHLFWFPSLPGGWPGSILLVPNWAPILALDLARPFAPSAYPHWLALASCLSPSGG